MTAATRAGGWTKVVLSMWTWAGVVLTPLAMVTGCAAVTTTAMDGSLLESAPHRPASAPAWMEGTRSAAPPRMAQLNPAPLATRTTLGSARSSDALATLLLRAGWNNLQEELPENAVVSPQKAARLLTALLQQPLALGAFPPRMAACHLLREVLASNSVSREELSRRVERFKNLAVLRPDGYLAWVLTGHTQQKVGPMTWRDESFRAGPFELGRFYSAQGGVFRPTDMELRPLMQEPPLAEVYDDADYLNRTLDGAEESFVALYHVMGRFLTRPLDTLAALQNLPMGVAALLASSPGYLERFRYMTQGEQIKALSKLTTDLIVTFGVAEGFAHVLSRASAGAEAMIPNLSLSADGALVIERSVVTVGEVATVLRGGPWAAVISQQARGTATGASENPRGAMRPAAEELLQQATHRPAEKLSGYRIFGNKGLVGQTFQRNILLIEAEQGASLSKLIAAFEAEARALGASRMSITGHAVINKGFLKPAIAERFGFQLRLINKDTIELVKELRP